MNHFACDINCVIHMQFVIRMPNYDLYYLQLAVYLEYFYCAGYLLFFKNII